MPPPLLCLLLLSARSVFCTTLDGTVSNVWSCDLYPNGLYISVQVMGKRKIHMQKPLFKAMESLTLRKIGPHFLLYATEDIDVQYRRNLSCPYEWLDPVAFRIRHYRSKSLEEYVQRRAGPDSAYQSKRYTKAQLEFEWHEANARCGKGDN